jgi:transcriptional regulator with XRE-family HTH domain
MSVNELRADASQLGERPDASLVGERLRTVRRRRGATLKQVAGRAQVSESFLSQLERGRAGVSISTLCRIAVALEISVAELFNQDGASRSRVLRREERPVLVFPEDGLKKHLLTPIPLENLEVILGELEPGGTTGDESYTHGDSEELFLVVTGVVQMELEADNHVLREGDSITYRSSWRHRFVNVGEETAYCLWIISPPSL